MEIISGKTFLTEAQLDKLIGKMPEPGSRLEVVSSQNNKQPVAIIDFETGHMKAVFVPNALNDEFVHQAYFGLRNAAQMSNNRGTAAGSGSRKRLLKDGTVSKTIIGGAVQSSVIGFFDRYPRMDFCRECAWNYAHPTEWSKALPLFAQISALFERYCPDKFNYQKAIAAKVHPDFIIPNTVFSTITVNKNFRTAIHRDGLNLKNSFSAFNVIRAGNYSGGLLVFPRYRIAIQCNNHDALFFMPQEPHGNTPITPMGSAPYERISLVYYLREKMQKCGSMAEELARGKQKHGGLA